MSMAASVVCEVSEDDRHLDRLTALPYRGPKLGAAANQPLRHRLCGDHLRVVARFVPLVCHAIEHDLNGAIDRELAGNVRHGCRVLSALPTSQHDRSATLDRCTSNLPQVPLQARGCVVNQRNDSVTPALQEGAAASARRYDSAARPGIRVGTVRH
jgi:hypothetical protein